jgi:hypothetical protein
MGYLGYFMTFGMASQGHIQRPAMCGHICDIAFHKIQVYKISGGIEFIDVHGRIPMSRVEYKNHSPE